MRTVVNQFVKLFGCSLLFVYMSAVAEVDAVDGPAQATQAEREVANERTPVEVQDPPELTPAQALAQLELPDNPTRAQCEAFVNQLRGFRSSDVGAKLAKLATKKMGSIPAEHIGVLTQILANNGPREVNVRQALEQFDPESYRKIVLDGLSKRPNYIFLIAQHGWYQDAKEDILAKLEDTDPFREDVLPIWFQAFVEVAEPEHYERLHEMTLNYRNLKRKLSLLGTLEGYDLARTVNACWDNLTPELRNKGFAYINRDLRPMAIANGSIDALNHAIEELINPFQGIANSQYNSRNSSVITPEFLVRRHLQFRGTHAEIAAWFNANRDELVFDTFEQRFQLLEDF